MPGSSDADHLFIAEKQGGEFATKTLTDAEGEGRLEYLWTPDLRTIVANCVFNDDKRYEMIDEGLVRFHFATMSPFRRAWRGNFCKMSWTIRPAFSSQIPTQSSPRPFPRECGKPS